MKHHLPLLLCAVFFAGCASAGTTSISQQNENPLTASRYGDELADTMAGIVISQDPIATDPAMRKLIDAGIAQGKQLSAVARQDQKTGITGQLFSVKQDAAGYALLIQNTLYLSSDFITDPGLDLHLYLTKTVDPREGQFPDDNAVDLGEIQSIYGAQKYTVPGETDGLRTVVIWDTRLKRLYGFGQLSK